MGPGSYEMVAASDFDGDGQSDPALFVAGIAGLVVPGVRAVRPGRGCTWE